MTKYIIVLPDGTEIGSGADAVNAIASTKLTTATNSGTDLTLGSVCAAMVECTLITPGAGVNITAGDEIILYTENDTGRSKVGIFTVEKPTRPSANRTKITAYDRVTRLDKDLTAWLGALNAYPYTLKGLARMVCTACEVELAEQEIPNGDFEIRSKPTSATVTGRQLMRWIAEIAGRFVTANEDGVLEYGWYTESGITVEPSGDHYYFAGSLSYEDYTVTAVDAVKIRLADSEAGALWPAGAAHNPYIVQGNKLLESNVTAAKTDVLGLMQMSANIRYRPCEVTVSATTGVKVGQIVTVMDVNGTAIRTLVMEAEQNGQTLTIRSTGSATRSSSENLNSVSDQDLKDYAEAAAENAVSAQTQEEIYNKLTNNGESQGIYLQDGKLYLNASFIGTGYMSADVIRAGRIRSTDFQLTEYPQIYPNEDTFPLAELYPSDGEQIVRGFEIDFEHGVIRGIFWNEITDSLQTQVNDLEKRISRIENALVYPKSAAI